LYSITQQEISTDKDPNNQIYTKGELLGVIVEPQINGKWITKEQTDPLTIIAIVDTGASHCIIQKEFAIDVLGCKDFDTDPTIFSTGNGPIQSVGKLTLKVRFGEEKYPAEGMTIEFTVMEGIPEPMFIGMGMIKEWIINCKDVNVEEKLNEGRKVLFTLLQQKRLDELDPTVEKPTNIATVDETQDEFESSLKMGNLTTDEKRQLRELIEEFKDVISLSTSELGRTNIEKHKINTKDHPPIAKRAYRENDENRKIIKEEVQKMWDLGMIRKSYGPWAFPVVIVKKKDGTNRFCIDYRSLNDITETDAYPMPRIDDLMDSFRNANYFTSLDLASGYWQIEMEEEDIPKTAFVCSQGKFECTRMPFGLKNAPATFQRAMNEAFDPYLHRFLEIYIDDLMTYSKTFREHLTHLRKVFEKLREINMKVKLKKCRFGDEEVEYLGHIVGRNGLRPDPKKIEKVKNIKPPSTLTEIRSFLGMCSYYRRFIKDFSTIAKPITQLMKKDRDIKWNEPQQKAFEELKQKLIEHPVLRYPDFDKEFIVATDASDIALGAVLMQKDENGKEYSIAYASKSLNETEQRYGITDKEGLAVIWAVQHFHKYLMGKKFTIITDHSALKFIKTQKFPHGRRGRWMMELQKYDFEIIHRAGKSNKNADALPRLRQE
jgi:hypothetical protein